MVPGCFFEANGEIWRLDAVNGNRWTLSRLVVCQLEGGHSVVADFPCRLLETESVRRGVLEELWKAALKTDEGSKHGRVEGNDYSGGSSHEPSVVTQQERFFKRWVAPPAWTPELLQMWGSDMTRDFFIGLETLGGYYEARRDEFINPGYSWVSSPLCVRDRQEAPRVQPEYVSGTVPDLTRFSDTSDPATILPHLRLIPDTILEAIAHSALHAAVRTAATIVLDEGRRPEQLALFASV